VRNEWERACARSHALRSRKAYPSTTVTRAAIVSLCCPAWRHAQLHITGHFTLRRAVRRGLPPQVVPLQFGNDEAADMPALGCAALRHVVNSQNVI